MDQLPLANYPQATKTALSFPDEALVAAQLALRAILGSGLLDGQIKFRP